MGKIKLAIFILLFSWCGGRNCAVRYTAASPIQDETLCYTEGEPLDFWDSPLLFYMTGQTK